MRTYPPTALILAVTLTCLAVALQAFGQVVYQPDQTILGFSLKRLNQSADFCYLTSKGREKIWLSREHYIADLAVKRLENSAWDLKDESKKTVDEFKRVIDLGKKSDLLGAIQDEQTMGAWLDKNCEPGTSLYLYQHRTDTAINAGYAIVKDGLVVNSLLLGAGGTDEALTAAVQAKQKTLDQKREQMAKPISWEWNDEKAKMSYCIANNAGKYQVVFKPNETNMFGTCQVMLGNREKYKWQGHIFTVFQISGNTLFYANCPMANCGGSIVAVNLKNGNKLWDSPLIGVGSVYLSSYSNRLNLELRSNIIVIFGRETYGDYIEIKDAKTGESIGHKILTQGIPPKKVNTE